MSKKRKKDNNIYKQLFISIIVILLYFVWPYIVNTIVSNLNLSDNLFASFIGNMIFSLITIFVYRKVLITDIKKFNNKFFKNLFYSIKWTILSIIIFLCLNQIIYLVFPNIEQENTNLILNIFKDNKVLLIINSLFYYSLVEEMVFKIPFKRFVSNKWLFIFITGFINAFFTIYLSATSSLSLVFIISYTALISCFSYVYYKKDTIISSILARMLYNLITILILTL